MPRFYEFFAGGGMARAGLGSDWECIFANDFSEQKAKSYRSNWGNEHLHVEDINKLSSFFIPDQAELAWASFPCQDLSLAGSGQGLNGSRSGTFWGFLNIIQELKKEYRKPSIIVFENVYGTLTANSGKDFESIAQSIVEQGYRFGAVVIDAIQFLPQSRPRIFIICVDDKMKVPKEIISDRASSQWHPDKVIRAFNSLQNRIKDKWLWWKIPEADKPLKTLNDIIEVEPKGVKWNTAKETQRLLSLMAPLHREKVLNAQRSGKVEVGTIYKRTRDGIQRAEVRFDGVAGCLRTPGGGSSRQTIMIVEGPNIRSRLISPREAARLMGLSDDYLLPEKYNEAYHLIGDGVVVPVVAHINQHVLMPLIRANKKILKADVA